MKATSSSSSSTDGKKKGGADGGVTNKATATTSTNNKEKNVVASSVTNTTSTTNATTTINTKGTVPATKDSSKELMDYVWLSIAGYILYRVCITAYQIRLGAINEFGPVIHEFDPYFNYRATEVCFDFIFIFFGIRSFLWILLV